MSVLLHKRREAAEEAIANLEDRRAEFADDLQQLENAARAIKGSPCGPLILHKLLDRGFAVDAGPREAVRFWLNHTGNADLPIKEEALSTAFHLPLKVATLAECALQKHTSTADPDRYWSDGKFTAPPVTDEERAAIMEREEIRAVSEADAELYRSAERMVNLANLRNSKEGVNVVSLEDLTTGNNVVYRGLIKEVPGGDHILDEPVFSVDPSGLNMVKTGYLAFDE